MQISFAVTAKLISAFVFATQIVQFLLYLTPKFQASSLLLCLYSSVCVGPVRKPHCWFSNEAAHFQFVLQLGWSGATKGKLKNAELPRDVQTAERLLNEHKELADDINAHKPV